MAITEQIPVDEESRKGEITDALCNQIEGTIFVVKNSTESVKDDDFPSNYSSLLDYSGLFIDQ
jgi:hypothetical protein